MFTLFRTSFVADFFYHPAEPECISSALADLNRDLLKVSGLSAEIKPYLPRDERGYILAGSLETPAFRDFLLGLTIDLSALEGLWEGCLICTFGPDDENLLICGSDRRGTMWGIYELCEKHLGVDPLYYWTDHEPEPMPALEIKSFCQVLAPKTFRFRGAFINDEDLLTEWRSGGGRRYANYPFYHQVAHPVVIEKVLETLLRLRMNLVIPASLLDIDNPAEENLVRLSVARGLYVSQHHVEPLGVSHFTWDHYWQARGETVEPSYVKNPDKFDQIWRHYARLWAQYPGVIWQLGLRGRGDRPAWFNDENVPPTLADRGKLISKAYAHQAHILHEVLGGEPFISTATLWMEGSELQLAGALTFPDRTITVFADFGSTQMMLDDFYSTPRKPEADYGVYHHVAFWGDGPHLVQGTSLEKLHYNYKNAVERGDTTYSILNICNLREFSLGIEAVARMNWDFAAFDLAQYRREWLARECGAGAVTAVEDVYCKLYQSYVVLDNTRFPGEMVLLDGITRIIGIKLLEYSPAAFNRTDFIHNRLYQRFASLEEMLAFYIPALNDGLQNWRSTYDAAFRALPQVAADRQGFFIDHFVVQIEIMLGLYAWCLHLCLATRARLGEDSSSQKEHLQKAVFAMEKLLIDRTKAEHGRWKNWYRGDKKMNLPGMLEKTRELLKKE